MSLHSPQATPPVRRTRRLPPAVSAAAVVATVTAVATISTSSIALADGTAGPSATGTATGTRATQTLCGSTLGVGNGGNWQDGLENEDARYEGLEAIRIYYGGLPQAWPGKVDVGGRPLTVSFKAAPTDIIDNTNGTLDTLRNWFATAPVDQDIYWSYYHEPEDNIKNGEFTAQQYRDAWKVLAQAAAETNHPRLRATLILMEWSLQPASGRNWRDYYPGADTIDVLGWDAYSSTKPAPTTYRAPEDMFGQIAQISDQEGLPFAIPETGTGLVTGDSGTGRAQWLRDVSSYLTEHGALFAEYFDEDWRTHDGPDYRLTDRPSRQAWTDFCNP
ncbi:hypothetical protein [Streptomyces odontomachi]|uniref:hypothetical protein n=1 Tax=Streptomyces odontomachi TaxID=2944940 RepID=UPI00210ACD9E|nr:hypothetical protein [Streptomyces sp. ODS25]